jgi:hypothetical protein
MIFIIKFWEPYSNLGSALVLHYEWQSTQLTKTNWIVFVKIKFHSNENIEWHCMQLELNFKFSNWIEFKYIELKRNVIQIDAKGYWKNVLMTMVSRKNKNKILNQIPTGIIITWIIKLTFFFPFNKLHAILYFSTSFEKMEITSLKKAAITVTHVLTLEEKKTHFGFCLFFSVCQAWLH